MGMSPGGPAHYAATTPIEPGGVAAGWRVSAAAVAAWKAVLALQGRADTHGELVDWHALRDALDELAREVGFDPLLIEPHRIADMGAPAVVVDPHRRAIGTLAEGAGDPRRARRSARDRDGGRMRRAADRMRALTLQMRCTHRNWPCRLAPESRHEADNAARQLCAMNELMLRSKPGDHSLTSLAMASSIATS